MAQLTITPNTNTQIQFTKPVQFTVKENTNSQSASQTKIITNNDNCSNCKLKPTPVHDYHKHNYIPPLKYIVGTILTLGLAAVAIFAHVKKKKRVEKFTDKDFDAQKILNIDIKTRKRTKPPVSGQTQTNKEKPKWRLFFPPVKPTSLKDAMDRGKSFEQRFLEAHPLPRKKSAEEYVRKMAEKEQKLLQAPKKPSAPSAPSAPSSPKP